MRQGQAARVLAHLVDDPAFAGAAAALKATLETHTDVAAAGRARAAAYAHLFHGAAGRRTVAPTQSAFTGGATHGEPWQSVRHLMAAMGTAPPTGFVEPEDHVGIQLELAAVLHQTVAEALRRDDDAAAASAEERLDQLRHRHLLVWLPDFCRAVRGADGDGFYRAAAALLDRLLTLEASAATA